jgi:hypothetical protein
MNESDINKAVITGINIVILLGLPIMFAWHIKQAKQLIHKSEDWIVQILIVFVYGLAICAEIPALWSRWIAYYTLKMPLPDGLYKLTTWDREGHAVFYAALFLLTYTFTRKKAPKIVTDTLG